MLDLGFLALNSLELPGVWKCSRAIYAIDLLFVEFDDIHHLNLERRVIISIFFIFSLDFYACELGCWSPSRELLRVLTLQYAQGAR